MSQRPQISAEAKLLEGTLFLLDARDQLTTYAEIQEDKASVAEFMERSGLAENPYFADILHGIEEVEPAALMDDNVLAVAADALTYMAYCLRLGRHRSQLATNQHGLLRDFVGRPLQVETRVSPSPIIPQIYNAERQAWVRARRRSPNPTHIRGKFQGELLPDGQALCIAARRIPMTPERYLVPVPFVGGESTIAVRFLDNRLVPSLQSD
jgi:hypothetical protein